MALTGDELEAVFKNARALEFLILSRCEGQPRMRVAIIRQAVTAFQIEPDKVEYFVKHMMGDKLIEPFNGEKIIATKKGAERYRELYELLAMAKPVRIG